MLQCIFSRPLSFIAHEPLLECVDYKNNSFVHVNNICGLYLPHLKFCYSIWSLMLDCIAMPFSPPSLSSLPALPFKHLSLHLPVPNCVVPPEASI